MRKSSITYYSKKVLAVLMFALTMVTGAKAQQNIYLYDNTGSEPQAIDLTAIRKIAFKGDNMVLTLITGHQLNVALAELQTLTFTPKPEQPEEPITAIASLKAQSHPGPKISISGGIISVSGWDTERTATVTVYTADGRRHLTVSNWSGADIDVSSLPHGLYIIKIGNQATKINK